MLYIVYTMYIHQLHKEVIVLTKIQKWGNSQGLRFSREILRKLNISIGDDVDVSIKAGSILINPVNIKRGKYKLKNLLSKMPSDYKTKEQDWGKTKGKEVW